MTTTIFHPRRTSRVVAPLAFAWLLLAAHATAAPGITVRELETAPGMQFSASNIADDGVVVGAAVSGAALRWRPGEPYESLGGDTASTANVSPLISRDGSAIVAGHWDSAGPWTTIVVRRWDEDEGWLDLPGMHWPTSNPHELSGDGSVIVGQGLPHVGADSQAWIWTEADGQRGLPTPEGMTGAEARDVSDDGRTVFGAAWVRDASGWPRTYAWLWRDGTPEQIVDAEGYPVGQAVACNSDCSLRVGGGPVGSGPVENPNGGLAWVHSDADGVRYLEPMDDPNAIGNYFAMDLSDDGRRIVGLYAVADEFGAVGYRGFVWTEDGGMESLDDLLARHGEDFGSDWLDQQPNAITADGLNILVAGMTGPPDYGARAGVIELPSPRIFGDGFER